MAAALIQGCAGPAKYDVAKFGQIQKVGILDLSGKELDFWADIDRSSNAYSAAGANNSKASQLSNLLSGRLKEAYPKMQDSLATSLRNYGLDASIEPVPRGYAGATSTDYSSIKEPLLLQCKIQFGFVLVKGGVMPSATIRYKLLASNKDDYSKRELRLERNLSIGYGQHKMGAQPELLGFPKKLYPNESYVLEHPDEVASDLNEMAVELGRFAALTIHQSTK